MKNILKRLAVLFAAVIIAAVFAMNSGADFGDFSGDSDYGGSDSSYDSDYDSDYSGGYSDGTFGGLIIPLIITAFVIMYIFKKGKAAQNNGSKNAGATPTTGLQPVDTIKQTDPNFSEEEIKERLSKLYIQMQNCWTAKDITPLRGDFTDSVCTV